MEEVGTRRIFSILDGASFSAVTNHQVRSAPGVTVNSFPDLVRLVAKLSFYNREHVLLFRGQSQDYLNIKGNTSVKPSLFRPERGKRSAPKPDELRLRYHLLRRADTLVSQHFPFEGNQRITRSRILRWAILQHYEVCATPLLDVTHSLRVAASFATNDPSAKEPTLYVLGVPALSGSVTASSEQGLQIMRLASICPPEASRPYFQEGYLLAEYPDLISMDDKEKYKASEIDFGRRLLAKFRLNPSGFWSADYQPIPNTALYPDSQDPLVEYTAEIKRQLLP